MIYILKRISHDLYFKFKSHLFYKQEITTQKLQEWIYLFNLSPPYNFFIALVISLVSTSYGITESGKQSSAMMTCLGLTGAIFGNCRSTLPTLFKIFGSLANHPITKVR